MLLFQIIEATHKKRNGIICKKNRSPMLEIFIENRLWTKMMGEQIQGHIHSHVMETYESRGTKIMGYKVHRVLTDNFGWKITQTGWDEL